MTPEQCEVQASQCRLLAEGTANPTIKLVLLDIARAWLQLKKQTGKPHRDGDGGTRPKRSRKFGRRVRAG